MEYKNCNDIFSICCRIILIFLLFDGIESSSRMSGRTRLKPRSITEENYDSKIPILHEGKPVEVSVSLELEAMDVINYSEQEITLFLDHIEEWNDFRLNRTKSNGETSTPTTMELLDDKVWSPDSYFLQSKETDLKKATRKVKPDGTIVQITKLRLTVHCPMNFFYFPFDKQQCSLRITNSEYGKEELLYLWKPTGVKIEKEIADTHEFELTGYDLANFTYQDSHSGVEMIIYLSRKTERNFPMFYFPAVALTTIAFLSLWMREKIFAISVSISSFLGMMIFICLMIPSIEHGFRMGLLDNYNFLCLNLILNAVTTNIGIYLMRLPPKRNSANEPIISTNGIGDCNDLLNGNANLELKSVSGGNSAGSDKSQSNCGEDAEDRIRKMGKFKQFLYFKSFKPAKKSLPIFFVVLNVAYWLWILIAALLFPKGEYRI